MVIDCVTGPDPAIFGADGCWEMYSDASTCSLAAEMMRRVMSTVLCLHRFRMVMQAVSEPCRGSRLIESSRSAIPLRAISGPGLALFCSFDKIPVSVVLTTPKETSIIS
jgi:hypothetical protein